MIYGYIIEYSVHVNYDITIIIFIERVIDAPFIKICTLLVIIPQ